MEKILQHLSKDKKLASILNVENTPSPAQDPDVYFTLIRSIISQQLSIKAAETIQSRFLDLFPSRYPEVNHLLKLQEREMRNCGLSYQKTNYIKNIAEFAQTGNLKSTLLDTLTDEDAILHLTQIKGVGRWTAQMILIFSLGREDVFPVQDLGIRNAMVELYNLRVSNNLLSQSLNNIAGKWAPYRSYATLALWNWKDNR